MKPGFGYDLPLIAGGAFLRRTVFKHYAHGFLVGRGEPDCGPGVGPAPADEALTLLVDRIGRSSLGIPIVCHQNGIERLCARIVTAMMSLEMRKAVPLPQALRDAIESYRQRTTDGSR